MGLVIYLARAFLKSSILTLSSRSSLFVMMNALYFGSILVAALLTQAQYPPLYEWPTDHNIFPVDGGFLTMVMNIFLFNLVVNGFLLVTLTGLLFFALPAGVVLMRAAFWGIMFNQLPTPQFLIALPTVILEGEGYIVASVAGINLGLSWLKPDWSYKGQQLSRLEALKMAFKECARVYILVAMLLLVAAIVETVTITF